MAVIKENVFESVAHGSLVRKEKKRSSRSELEIVKTQEKFGTKHQRPCALCEQSFSEVNLVLAVPFKVKMTAVRYPSLRHTNALQGSGKHQQYAKASVLPSSKSITSKLPLFAPIVFTLIQCCGDLGYRGPTYRVAEDPSAGKGEHN